MNNVALVGRLTKNPEVKYTEANLAFCRLTVAVVRPVKAGENKQSDFIPCIVFNKRAEAFGKWGFKGQKVGIIGHIQTGSYKNNNGETVYTTDVVVDRSEFLEWKDRTETQGNPNSKQETEMPEDFTQIEENIPF